MAITWDTPTTYTNGTPFTTAQTFAHTVGSGSNRYIWVGISTEDFSNGGGGQTPSSVTYNGNAMTADGIITAGSVQTATIYSGLDTIMGSGSNNVVITYAGEVNALVAFAVSCDEMAQAVKEATGSTVSTNGSYTGGTSTVTTVTNGAVIMAMTGNDNWSVNKTTSWNVGTEVGDDVSTGVAGAMLRYELATAGSQDIIATIAADTGRFVLLSFAYAPFTNTAPTITDPGAKRLLRGGDTVTGLGVSDPDGGDITMTFGATNGTFTMPNAAGAGITINSGSGTGTLEAVGTVAEWTSLFAQASPNGLVYTNNTHTADTITVDADDDQAASATQVSLSVTMIDGRISASTMADLNAVLATLAITEASAKTVVMTAYAIDSGDRTDTDNTTVTVTAPASTGAAITITELTKVTD